MILSLNKWFAFIIFQLKKFIYENKIFNTDPYPYQY